MGRIALWLVTSSLAWALASAAVAQTTDAERTAAARALFEQGMRAVDAGDWEEAADRLDRSYALRPSPVVRFNLALALSELGRVVEASEHLRGVQRETGEGSEAYRLAGERLEAILPRLGRLRIDVTGARESVEVRLDGDAVPTALIGVPQPADPGARRVSIHRGGEELGARDVTVTSGQLATVELDAPEPPPEPDPALVGTGAPVQEDGGVETQWWFWTLIAALAVGAGVGIGLAVWSESSTPQDAWLRGDDGRVHMTLVEVVW